MTSGRKISDTYHPELEVVGDPDLTLQIPSMKAIDDALRFDTGTFVPKLYSGGALSPSTTYLSQQGSYYCIGDLVHVTVNIRINAVGDLSNTGDTLWMSLGDLGDEFEAYDQNNNHQTIGMLYKYVMKNGTGTGVPDGGMCAAIENGYKVVEFRQSSRSLSGTGTTPSYTKSGGDMVPVRADGLEDGSELRFSGVYRRAAL